MQWSTYQQAVFNAVSNTDDNIMIDAVAGSGKTTTLIGIVDHLAPNTSIVFLAFNKHIADELQKRLPGVECKTMHSLGYNLLRQHNRKTKYQKNKLFNIAKTIVEPYDIIGKYNAYGVASLLANIVALAHGTMVNVNSVEQVQNMLFHYGMMSDVFTQADKCRADKNEFRNHVYKWVAELVQKSVDTYHDTGEIDYSEMIYLPVLLGYTAEYDVALIDEAQDLNRAQLLLTKRISKRVIGVSDKFQAIQGFSGALNDSFEQFVALHKATVYPLSICYRCPSSHLDLARKLVPHIENRPDAQVGTIQNITIKDMVNSATPNDLIICRRNAPLINMALAFIAAGIPAKVRGRDFSTTLNKIVDDIAKIKLPEIGGFEQWFSHKLTEYRNRKSQYFMQDGDEAGLQLFNDKLNCILYVMERMSPDNIDEIKDFFTNLYSDDTRSIMLSSIHRAKGLEANNVFIIDPDRMQVLYPTQQEWQVIQEENVEYVGLTRAKQALYFVR